MSADAFSAFEEVGLSNRKELSTVGKRYFNFDVNLLSNIFNQGLSHVTHEPNRVIKVRSPKLQPFFKTF